MKRPSEILTLFVGAILTLGTAFGVDITEQQAIAILGVIATMPAFITFVVETWRSWRSDKRVSAR